MPPPRAAQVSAALHSLAELNVTLTDILLFLLMTKDPSFELQQTTLATQTWELLDAWSCLPASTHMLRQWVHHAAKSIYTEQVQRLTQSDVGLQFNAFDFL